MAESPLSSVGNLARDWVYLVAGVGVIAFQKAQVARREISERLDREAATDRPSDEPLRS